METGSVLATRVLPAAAFGPLIAVWLLASAAHSEELKAPVSLFLVCRGISTGTVQETSSISDDDSSASASMTTDRIVKSERSYQFELNDAGGRVRVPTNALPLITTKKTDGWFTLSALSLDDEKIVGRFSLNVLNRPSFRIDRRTGDIEMKGYGFSFSGACERGSTEPAARKF